MAHENVGAGDSYLVQDVLPVELAEGVFEKLHQEVQWNKMMHRGGEVPRLVAVQGQVEEDGSYPIYRHPSDESPPLHPFTPTVSLIRAHVERRLGGQPVNHALIQFYRSGADFISEHSDKTVDVVRDSKIVNVSVGAQRVMTLRTKKDAASASESGARTTQRVPLPHNSMFVMGLETNRRWLHAINHDNRPKKEKSEAETRFDGARISLTFRSIGTYLSADGTKIYGQGATGKTKEDAKDVLKGTEEAEKLLAGFGKENHESEFDWDAVYGEGFDVLHFRE